MALEVTTQDCTAVSDAELEEMADLCAEGPNPFSVGLLSQQKVAIQLSNHNAVEPASALMGELRVLLGAQALAV